MKRQTRLILIGLALTATLLLATGSAAAKKETRRDFTGTHYLCTVGVPEPWYTGPMEHVRGLTWTGRAESLGVDGEPLYNADSHGTQNWNLNTKTGSGGVWGTFTKEVDDVDGTWEGTYAGKYVDNVSYIHVVGHGTGELAGMKYFATFDPIIPPPETGPCATVLAASTVTGVIVDTTSE
jgi:hypothetical protein